MRDEALRVVIADDRPHHRKGLARLLRENGIDVVGQLPNGEAAIRAAKETAADLVVMDLNLPDMSGTEATRRLLERAPESRVIMLSGSARRRGRDRRDPRRRERLLGPNPGQAGIGGAAMGFRIYKPIPSP
jgi:CheY-like chemotaxis protein